MVGFVELCFFGRRHAQRAHHPEPRCVRLGELPNALWIVGVFRFPIGIRGLASCAAEFVGIAVPATAANDAGIDGSRHQQRIANRLPGELLIVIGVVGVENPFPHVSVHVVKSPGIRLLLADLLASDRQHCQKNQP